MNNQPATIQELSWDQYRCGSMYTSWGMKKIRFENKYKKEVMRVKIGGMSIEDRLRKSGLVGGRAGKE